MALKDHNYLCVKCGHKQVMRLKDTEIPRRRLLLACSGCKGRKQFFYPAVRPLSGHYR